MKHYGNWCSVCIMAAHQQDSNTVTMLSGYCLTGQCDKCRRTADLAFVCWRKDCPVCKESQPPCKPEPYGLDMAGELNQAWTPETEES